MSGNITGRVTSHTLSEFILLGDVLVTLVNNIPHHPYYISIPKEAQCDHAGGCQVLDKE